MSDDPEILDSIWWHERLGALNQDGSPVDPRRLNDPEKEIIMTPEQVAELMRFNMTYKIVPTSIFSLPRWKALQGDCQTYARNIRRILNLKPWQAVMWRCWSKEGNPRWLPRHAVLWVKGQGWIDSTHRQFRDDPDPHVCLWPVGTPAVAWLIYSVGVFKGWFPLINPIEWFL